MRGNISAGRLCFAAAAGLALAVVGCAATKEAPVEKKGVCAFLGSDCNRLTPGGEGHAALRYVNPNAQWTQYTKVLIDPVTFWGTDTTSVSVADQQKLTNFFYEALTKQLGKRFKVVDTAQPG